MPYIEPNLGAFEKKVYSQFGEDGVIEQIASCLGFEKGTCFEFGIGKNEFGEMEGNFWLLREKGWKCVFLDGQQGLDPSFGVRREFITALNINELYGKHDVPDDLDFMSIDVDGQDFWIWMALMHRPKLIIIEINGGLPFESSVTIQFDVNHVWDGTIYQGASLRALDKLARCKQYTLVHTNGINAFFIRDDLVSNRSEFSLERLQKWGPTHPPDPHGRPWVQI